MATIDFIMRGKKPGETKIRRTVWPRSMWVRPTIKYDTKCGELWFVQRNDKTEGLLKKDDDEATDWVIVTDAKPRK